MKFTTGIFFTILLAGLFVSNAQKAFVEIKALMNNLKNANIEDQKKADIREAEEKKWCDDNIAAAKKLVARRQKDVDDLKAHIVYLQKTRVEAQKDMKTRIDRIAANKALLKKFKDERCDNNLLFVKQLREIMQAMEVMKLLRGDIVAYFDGKKKGHRGVAFLQSFEEYSHLLDEDHKKVFAQLKVEVASLKEHKFDRDAETQKKNLAKTKDINAHGDKLTKEDERTKKEIGTGHVDNKRGELKRLAVPEHQKIAAFNKDTRVKVLGMIDGMIKHLKETREHLTKLEIKAAEDFAIFQNSMEEENERLVAKIAELKKEIAKLTAAIAVSKGQLVKREKLLAQAKEKLRLLIKMCKEKMAYFAKETARRNKENGYINKAMAIFDAVLKKLSDRVRARVNSKVGADGKFHVQDMGHRVVKSVKHVRKHVKDLNAVRNEVVL